MERSYEEMIKIDDYKARYEYLKLNSIPGDETFGSHRHLNQKFYRSKMWTQLRNRIIVRDEGCDLAHKDFEIPGRIIIHHINPIAPNDIVHGTDMLMDPNNLVCVSHQTHNAIHYGDTHLLAEDYVGRAPGDTKLW